MIFETYRIPANYASALINDDYSGLSDEDETELNEWIERVQPGHATCPDGEPFFAHGHDINRSQGANCYDVVFIKLTCIIKRTYQRSRILFFHELTKKQQLEVVDEIDTKRLHDETFVLWNNSALPLSMFIRTNKGLFNGVHAASPLSAYLVRLNKTNEFATVVYAHW